MEKDKRVPGGLCQNPFSHRWTVSIASEAVVYIVMPFDSLQMCMLSSVILHATLYACTSSVYKHMEHWLDSHCHTEMCVHKHVLTLDSLMPDNEMYCLKVSYDHHKHFATDSFRYIYRYRNWPHFGGEGSKTSTQNDN